MTPRTLPIPRREFLRQSGWIALTATSASALVSIAFRRVALAGDLTEAQLQALRAGLVNGTLLLPTDPAYGSAAPVYNGRYKSRPRLIAQCTSAAEVAHCVKWSREVKIALHTRAAGNSYEGFSTGPGLVIDLGRLNGISVDAANRTVVLGAGARLGAVYQKLDEQGLVLPAGSCPQVAISGLTLGGGHGFLARKFGLTCDHLIEAEVVTAQGEVVRARADHHSDLFWALRGGGGGSFGIVTRFFFRARAAVSVVTFRMVWSTAKAWPAFDAWQRYAPTMPDGFAAVMHVEARAGGALKRITSVGQFVGTAAELRAALKPWLAEAPLASPITIVPRKSYLDAVKYLAGGSLDTSYRPANFKAASDYVFNDKLITETGFKDLVAGLGAGPRGGLAICDAYGGAINRVPTTGTAFAHRVGARYCIQYFAQWGDSSLNAAYVNWMKALRARMAPHVSGACYVNYADLELNRPLEAYFGANLPRLKRIKAKWDPEQIFKHAQSVVPNATATNALALVSPAKAALQDPVQVAFRLVDDTLVARFNVRNPKPAVRDGKAITDQPTPQLYNSEVVELFVAVNGLPKGSLSRDPAINRYGADEQVFPYYEFEVSPRAEYLEVKVLSPKVASGDKRFDTTFKSGFKHFAKSVDGGWVAELHIPLKKLGWNGDPTQIVGNAFAILGAKPARSYWSLYLPKQDKPDFHRPRYFERLLVE